MAPKQGQRARGEVHETKQPSPTMCGGHWRNKHTKERSGSGPISCRAEKWYLKSLEHLLGVLINLNLGQVERRLVRDSVHLPLALLLLQLERNATDRAAGNALHQVLEGGEKKARHFSYSAEPSDLVTELLGGDDRDLLGDLLVGVEVSAQARIVWKFRARISKRAHISRSSGELPS